MTDATRPVESLASALRRRGWTIAVAESCTGGALGARITDLPGVSDVFTGGIIAYDNAVKTSLLDVPASTIADFGAVSAETARAMARGCRRRLGSEVAIAITGIAGPGGGTAEKPVGLVFIAVSVPGGDSVRAFVFDGDRAGVRRAAVDAALEMALRGVAGSPGPSNSVG